MKTTIFSLVTSAVFSPLASAFTPELSSIGIRESQRNIAPELYSKHHNDDTNVDNRRAFLSSSSALVASSFFPLVAHPDEETIDDLAMPSAEEQKKSVSVGEKSFCLSE